MTTSYSTATSPHLAASRIADLAAPILFGLTLFVSAALLFWVQLFVSKMVLPVLGGSAAVWNTCMVFFQTGLLLGYLYAHASERYLRGRLKVLLHPALLALAGLVLPITLAGIAPPATGASPVAWLLGTLFLIVGAPYFVLAGTAPLVQAWYARSGARSAHDPFFLYAVSNLGSLLALLSYPVLIEPRLHLTNQSRFWAIGYFVLVALATLCALIVMRVTTPSATPAPVTAKTSQAAPSLALRLRWVLLAFAPSSLLLGVTTHLTTDVAAAPLFWVIPLALYLLSFVVAFQRFFVIPERLTALLQALLLACLGGILLAGQQDSIITLFGLHLTAFFVTALMCHQELARLRPSTRDLTEFYLLISAGGALGGMFNALLAPVLFNDILEYPVILVVACMLRPGPLPKLERSWTSIGDIALPVLLFLVLALLRRYANLHFELLGNNGSLIAIFLAVLVAFAFRERPVRFGLAVGALLLAAYYSVDTNRILAHTRNFYGVLKVIREKNPPLTALYNGTTLHGMQSTLADDRLQPLSYYHHKGPLGRLFAAIDGTKRADRVGMVGLGTGTIACYEKPGQHWSYFEINPADVAIARNRTLFTFLSDCPGHPNIVLGDARLSLAKEPAASFDMLIFDAFTSDAIPIHLITREAVTLYLTKLRPQGLLVFHISNRFLDLGPVLANIASSLDLSARRFDDEEEDSAHGKDQSDWVVIARNKKAFEPIDFDARWKPLSATAGAAPWTDDYSDLFGAFTD
jgi:spermidine synthase